MSPAHGWNVEAEPFYPLNLLERFNNIDDNDPNNQAIVDNDPNNQAIDVGFLFLDVEDVEDVEDDFDYDRFLRNIDLAEMGLQRQGLPEMVRQFAN